ncbi:Uncharacterized protein HZ326_15445 [Fusarium oxysporum f. sp. albedinis]|nr:Uncharacterized protein HZ326_15445 [Fusarium oxysporum f. sp. albedinis]
MFENVKQKHHRQKPPLRLRPTLRECRPSPLGFMAKGPIPYKLVLGPIPACGLTPRNFCQNVPPSLVPPTDKVCPH